MPKKETPKKFQNRNLLTFTVIPWVKLIFKPTIEMQKFSILIASFIIFFGFSQRPKPAPAQKNPIAIINATIHTATGSVLENSSVVFDNGKITQINGSIPQNAKVIDAKNKHCLLYTSRCV